MKHPNKDFVAEAIADYEAMKQEEQGQLLVQIMEDQPFLMGFITNLADDFSDSEHAVLVDSTVILINAFVSAGIPISMIPHQMLEEVINERVDSYEAHADELQDDIARAVTDSPMVFEDLRNRALFKSNLKEEDLAARQKFSLILDTIIAIVERSISVEIEEKGKNQ
ncbi:MAG: hypothetical protein U5L96_01455 [Owenweeksia sp.]|nr:hypothetical protein [Owenweeksia sp.]